MLGKKCKNDGCNNGALEKSPYCRQCYNRKKAEQARVRAKKNGHWQVYKKVCIACGAEYAATNQKQKFCKSCAALRYATGYIYNGYTVAGGGGYCFKHRKIAETILGRKLNSNEVVHHVNCIETDNALTNLIVMSRKKHGALHAFLREQRVIMAKAIKENFEDCWKNSILSITNAWLETANVKVEKLWEVSQSAAEPLNAVAHEEGSETVHEAPSIGEDTVQTTTFTDGLGDKE